MYSSPSGGTGSGSCSRLGETNAMRRTDSLGVAALVPGGARPVACCHDLRACGNVGSQPDRHPQRQEHAPSPRRAYLAPRVGDQGTAQSAAPGLRLQAQNFKSGGALRAGLRSDEQNRHKKHAAE